MGLYLVLALWQSGVDYSGLLLVVGVLSLGLVSAYLGSRSEVEACE
jgi:hypothetical protein